MEQQIIANGGLQCIPQIAVQYVYLDFDGELTRYNGEILTVDEVDVQHSNLTAERIAGIVSELNALFADKNVIFVTEKPIIAEYSTIYIGKTEAFSPYGSFAGLAETIDEGNKIKSDNAFVMLDSTATDVEIISIISHETSHLLGTLDHGGDGLAAYADVYVVKSGVTSTGIVLYHDSMYISSGGVADNTSINNGSMYISSGGTANKTTVNYGGGMSVGAGGSALFVRENGGRVWLQDGAYVTFVPNTIEGLILEGIMTVHSNTTAVSTVVRPGGEMYIYSGGVADHTSLDGGMVISSAVDIDSGIIC